MDGTPFGRYRLVELLGRGGMGEVWRAHDTAANNRTVAIKLLPPHLAGDTTFVVRFRREADAAARLNNPHIIPIHNYGEIDGRLYVDMRLIEGRDLQQVLADGPLEPARAVRIIEQVAEALQAAHEMGLVHRDVKPSNILLDKNDFAYLIDFGIARGADETRLTGTGSVIGSWPYMSPERLRAGQVDARSDIYALACVLYECLTGSTPYPGDNFEQQITAHLTEPPPRPSSTDPNMPVALDTVIATGMAKKPDQRYATTKDLAKAARAALTTPGSPAVKRARGTSRAGSAGLGLRYAARTDRGLVQGNNEDSVYAGARLQVVADGMGNPAGGSLASREVILALAHLDDEEPGRDMLTQLDLAVRQANGEIADHVKSDPYLKGMGSTLTAIWFAGHGLALAHIGGSRAYLLRDGDLTQITQDEFSMGPTVSKNRVAAPARTRMMRRLTGDEVAVTLKKLDVRAGDRYLLCTHGLSDLVSEEAILEALKIPDVAESADRLIELALRGGGRDNVTVVVSDVVLYDFESREDVKPDNVRV